MLIQIWNRFSQIKSPCFRWFNKETLWPVRSLENFSLSSPNGGVLFDPSPLVLGVSTKTPGTRKASFNAI